MMVGIDFGTSTSEIAYVNEQGRLVLVPNHEYEFITPSVVHIAQCGTVTVGREAKERALLEPECTFLEVKRLFGQDVTLTAWGKSYSPVDIAAMIIKYLVDCAESHIGSKVDSAIITVPAYFTDAQRKDVIAAGNAVGLTVERIINEPTAAALDYGVNHMDECKNILVYDLGGGTLDVTVLELFEGVVDVKASCGNSTLGGKDFDQALIDHICNSIKKRDRVDVTTDVRAMMRIKLAAETCKIELSSRDEYRVNLPFLLSDKNDIPVGFSSIISRKSFEGMIRELIFSTKTQIDMALGDANITAQEVDLVLLVGGSTRTPIVASFLEEHYGFKPESSIDADLAVVRGAAIQAGVLSGVLGEDTIVLTDICPYSLSTAVLRSTGFIRVGLYCDILIPRNTTLPAEFSKLYRTSSDNQTEVHISAYQGESEVPEENYLLNQFVLSGIPKGKAGKEKINIKFAYDLNGILKVSAEIASTGKTAAVAVNTAEVGENMDLTAWKSADAVNKYRKIINKADRLIKIHGEAADEIETAANELKKGLILNWDAGILEKLESDLIDAIDLLEE
ncbi:MAG: Hsp70 family protein [Firmicutes bacterium]|nr:Hsp70 family protein [Bacillota bacterium]